MQTRRDRPRRGSGRVGRAAAHPVVVVAMVPMMLTVSACDGGEGDGDEAAAPEVPIVGTVTVPEERLSPFCQAMIELGDRLLTDPPADPDQLIIDTYEGIEDDVPSEIAADFDAVLAGLRGDPPPPETSAVDTAASTAPPSAPDGSVVDEFIVPPATPAERLNDYVEFTCRSTLNNPGPPATAPVVDVTGEDDGEG